MAKYEISLSSEDESNHDDVCHNDAVAKAQASYNDMSPEQKRCFSTMLSYELRRRLGVFGQVEDMHKMIIVRLQEDQREAIFIKKTHHIFKEQTHDFARWVFRHITELVGFELPMESLFGSADLQGKHGTLGNSAATTAPIPAKAAPPQFRARLQAASLISPAEPSMACAAGGDVMDSTSRDGTSHARGRSRSRPKRHHRKERLSSLDSANDKSVVGLSHHLVRLSKALCSLLRYQQQSLQLTKDAEGFVPLEEIRQALDHHDKWSDVDIRNVVKASHDSNEMPRFELKESSCAGTWIRCTTTTKTECGLLNDIRMRRLSKAFSAVLRHTAFQEKLLIMPDGFAPVDDVLRVIHRLRAGRSEVEHLVQTSRHQDGTPRFELKQLASQPWIRATRHHTLEGMACMPKSCAH